MANSILAKMAVQISANTAEFSKVLKSASIDLNKFSNDVKNIATTVAGAFAVREIAGFALEVSKLAGEADAVRVAFERLPNATRLMSELKRATGGTVSELELMKRAVQASNFDISLEALPRLLEFATLRAQQTGQSVDYLVDSVVTGIGRKSKLILDNLGISAAQLSAEFNGASLEAQSVGDVAEAVGRIAEKALGNMAGFSENANTKLQRLNAEWENTKVRIGEAANETGILGKAIDALTEGLQIFAAEVTAEDELGFFIGLFKQGAQEADIFRAKLIELGVQNKLSFNDSDIDNIIQKYGVAASKANELRKELKGILAESNTLRNNQGVVDVDPLTGLPISGGTAYKKATVSKQIQSINSLKQKLEELTATFNSTDESQRAKLKTIGDEIIKTEQLIKEIENLKKAQEPGFKSAANIGFGGAATSFTDQSITGSLGVAKIPQAESLFDIDGKLKKLDEFVGKLKEVKTQVETITVDFGSMIGNFVADIAYAFGQSMNGTVKFGDAFLRGIANFAVQFGEILIAAGFAGKAIQEFGKSNPALAVVAGAALIAVGAALSSSLSSGLNKASGGFGAGSFGQGTRPTLAGVTNNEQRIIIEMKAKGSDLVAVYDSAKADNRIRKGRG